MVLPDPYTPMDGENKAITTKKKKRNSCDMALNSYTGGKPRNYHEIVLT